jgi:hypothetical protein
MCCGEEVRVVALVVTSDRGSSVRVMARFADRDPCRRGYRG